MTLHERWLMRRNRLLADPRFQRFAARTPLLRMIARRRARALFDLVAGFVYSQVTYACVETRLLAILDEGPQPIDAIAARTGLSREAATTLLLAAQSLGLVESAGDRWVAGPHGAALAGSLGIMAMVAHHRHLYADLADPAALLRRGGGGGALSGYWPYAAGAEGEADSYSRLMAESQQLIATPVLDAYDLARHSRLLDVGGGEGAFIEAVAARHPRLALDLFDLPAVAQRAAARLGERAAVHAGSFRTDPLPRGADIVTLIRVLHDHGDSAVRQLLAAVHAALPPGGTLLIAEPLAATAGAEPAGHAYFGLYLWAMGSGRPRTADEYREMLRSIGFTDIVERPTPIPLTVRVLTARKSA